MKLLKYLAFTLFTGVALGQQNVGVMANRDTGEVVIPSTLELRLIATEGSTTEINDYMTAFSNKVIVIEGNLGVVSGRVDSVEGDILTLDTNLGVVSGRVDSVEDNLNTLSNDVDTLWFDFGDFASDTTNKIETLWVGLNVVSGKVYNLELAVNESTNRFELAEDRILNLEGGTNDWNTAFSWGDYSLRNYVTEVVTNGLASIDWVNLQDYVVDTQDGVNLYLRRNSEWVAAGTMAQEDAGDYYDKLGTDAEITALNLGTMSSETATDYDTSLEVDAKVAASTNSFPAAGITTIADAATLELSGATGNYFSAPTTWRTNTLSIAGTAADYGYSLFLASTNPVALAADMIAFGDLPDNIAGRVFGFTPHTNSTWLVIGVTP